MLDSKGRTLEQRWYESRLGRRFLRCERWVLSAAMTFPVLSGVLILPYILFPMVISVLPFLVFGLIGAVAIGSCCEMPGALFFSILVIPTLAPSIFVMAWMVNWYFVALGLFFGYTSSAERKSRWLAGLGA